MKSILNDINRLEKAFELLQRLAVACNEYNVNKTSSAAHNRFRAELCKANAFLEKYGNDK